MCLFALIFRKGGHPIMPKTKLQNIIFTLIMAFVMVYAMVCYNIALDKGGMTNEIFLLAFHEIPIMWPIACILEYFVVEKLSRKLAFRMVSPEDKSYFYHTGDLFHDRMPDVPGDEFYCHLSLHASRQSDHRSVATEDRPELPYGAVLADLFRRSRSTECLWVCCREK